MSDNFKIMANIENHTQMLDYFIPLMRMMTKDDIVQYGLTGRLLRGGIVDYGEGKTRRGGVNLKQWNIRRDQELNSGWMSDFLKLFDDREVGRIRIMRLKPRTCYSLHVDLTPRVHVPIITNSENFMIIDVFSFVFFLIRILKLSIVADEN